MTRRAAAGAVVFVALALALGACGGSSSKKAASKATTTTVAAARLAVSESFLRQSFDQADTNHDGVVDVAEMTAMINGDYKAMDVNHDGTVTVADITADVQNSNKKQPVNGPLDQYLAFDYDHNGRIDIGEYQRHLQEMFGAMDTNHDGRYTFAEVHAFYGPKGGQATTTTTKSALFGGTAAAFLFAPFAFGRRIRRAAVVMATVAAVVVASAAPVGASAVYNDAKQPYFIWFACGWFCGNRWEITNQGPNNWDAYPGKSGTYYIFDDNKVGCEDTASDHQQPVTDHGWSVLSSTGSSQTDLQWNDYNDSGGQIAQVTVIVNAQTCFNS